MNGQMILVKVENGSQEGWALMAFDEFLQKVNLAAWGGNQLLVGMVLPRPAPERRAVP